MKNECLNGRTGDIKNHFQNLGDLDHLSTDP